MKVFQKSQNSLSLVASKLFLCSIAIDVVQYACAKELAHVIFNLYQENYRKFEAYVLISDMKPNDSRKFSGNCLLWA